MGLAYRRNRLAVKAWSSFAYAADDPNKDAPHQRASAEADRCATTHIRSYVTTPTTSVLKPLTNILVQLGAGGGNKVFQVVTTDRMQFFRKFVLLWRQFVAFFLATNVNGPDMGLHLCGGGTSLAEWLY
jgi:hypothetical protein